MAIQKMSVWNSVLIIDDDIKLSKSIKRILNSMYNVKIANSLDTASNILLEQEFAVIILDYELGNKVDGVMFSQHVNKLYPLTYIVMLTGYTDFSLAKRALNEGSINYFMHKPFNAEKLKSIISEAVAKHNSNKEISTILRTDEGIESAKQMLASTLDENLPHQKQEETDLIAVVASKNSIPVFSKFIDQTSLQNFTDTIFAGFMNALTMLGQEAFTMENNLNVLKFGNISICFKFVHEYQFSFIIFSPNNNKEKIEYNLQQFVDEISDKLIRDDSLFVWSGDKFAEIELLIDELRSNILSNN